MAHDAHPRWLGRLEPESEILWEEVENLVQLDSGYLVVDDTTIDKPYGPHIELVTPHWSGQHRAVVEGLNLITLLWTDGDLSILSTGLFLTKRTMERVRMTTCGRCSRRLGRLVLNLIVYFGSHGILAWITSNCCASGTSHFSLV